MDGTWLDRIPQNASGQDDITPESFSESFWHLASGEVKHPAPDRKFRAASVQEHNFQHAPESVRKGWLNSGQDSLHPLPSPRSETLFSFAPMDSHNKNINAVNASIQQNAKPQLQIDDKQLLHSAFTSAAPKIQPNGIAPIGSEMQEMKKAQDTHSSALVNIPAGNHSRKSSSTSSTVTVTAAPKKRSGNSTHGATLNQIREAFPSPRGLWNRTRSSSEQSEAAFRSGASEHDQFFYPPPGAKQQLQIANAESSKAATQTAGVHSGFALMHHAGCRDPTPMNANTMFGEGPHMTGAQVPHIMFRRDLSSEDLAALQTQSFQAGQRQIMMSYENDIQAMIQRHCRELTEKEKQLKDSQETVRTLQAKLAALQSQYDTNIVRMGEEFKAMEQKMAHFGRETKTLNEKIEDKITTLGNKQQEHQILAISNVTPTNQVVFKEPATHAPPTREQLALQTDIITPEGQTMKAVPAAFTFPGAIYPTQHVTHANLGYASPEFITQQRLSTNSVTHERPFQDKQFEVMVNVADDVFDDPSQRPGPGLRHFFKTLGFQQKGLHEALSSCFGKVEHAVRLLPLVKMTGHTQSEPIRNVIVMCQDHIEHRSEVYSILSHKDEKYLLISGVINGLITSKVFCEPVITAFECEYQSTMIQRWTEEQQSRETDIMNIKRRSWLGKQRAEVANLVIQVNGFWKWVKDHTHRVTDNVMSEIQAAFPRSCHASLRRSLWAAVNDAIRIAVRIRQDPRYFEYHFQRVGCTWDNRYMVARNAELAGQELSNVRTPYVTRCTTRPLVKVKNFDGFDGTNSTIHKAEVLLSERKNTLRPYGRPGQFARGHRQQ